MVSLRIRGSAPSLKSTALAIPASASIARGSRVWARKRFGTNPKTFSNEANGGNVLLNSTSRRKLMFACRPPETRRKHFTAKRRGQPGLDAAGFGDLE